MWGFLYSAGNGNEDIIIGYQDGSVIIYSVHPEFFLIEEISSQYDSSEIGEGNTFLENENLALVEEFKVMLPFPIVGLAYGSFLSEVSVEASTVDQTSSSVQHKSEIDFECNDSEEHSSQANDYMLLGEQLAVLTSKDFRLFVKR